MSYESIIEEDGTDVCDRCDCLYKRKKTDDRVCEKCHSEIEGDTNGKERLFKTS